MKLTPTMLARAKAAMYRAAGNYVRAHLSQAAMDHAIARYDRALARKLAETETEL